MNNIFAISSQFIPETIANHTVLALYPLSLWLQYCLSSVPIISMASVRTSCCGTLEWFLSMLTTNLKFTVHTGDMESTCCYLAIASTPMFPVLLPHTCIQLTFAHRCPSLCCYWGGLVLFTHSWPWRCNLLSLAVPLILHTISTCCAVTVEQVRYFQAPVTHVVLLQAWQVRLHAALT